MSEKRFTLVKKGNGWIVDDNSRKKFYLSPNEVVKLLNSQQNTIEEQNKQIEEWEFSFRTEMAHHRVAEKELQEKIMKVKQSNNHYYTEYYRIKEENEQLRQQVQNAKEVAVKNDMQYQICRKEKEDFQDMCEQLRQQLKTICNTCCYDCEEKWCEK